MINFSNNKTYKIKLIIYPKIDPINKDGGGQGVRSMEGGWEGEYFNEGD